MNLLFHWEPDNQVFTCGDKSFLSSSLPPTAPSHDLAHLIVGAGGLPWFPAGDRHAVCIAEYNGVMLENFYDKCIHAANGRQQAKLALVDTVKYLRWFVDEHYKPFPCSSEEAYRRFCRGVNVEMAVRLFPYFYVIKSREASHPTSFMTLSYHLEFTSDDQPESPDVRCTHAQELVRTSLEEVCG